MSAITNSTGFYVTGADDGAKHEKRHGYADEKEQLWKQYDSEKVENVIEISDTKKSDDTKNLAYKKAYEQGMKTEDEWAEANAKRSKKRQNANYEEYVTNTGKSVDKGLSKLSSGKNERKRQLAHMQKAAIKANGGLAINGTLYYIGSVEDYQRVLDESGSDGLARYREFERDTLKTFHDSDVYQTLHGKTEIRAEIHTAENGAQHLQTSEVLGKTNKRGVYAMSPVALKEDALLNYYIDREGSVDAGRKAYETDLTFEYMLAESTAEVRSKLNNNYVYSNDDVRTLYANNVAVIEKNRNALFANGRFDKMARKGDYVRRLFRRVENDELERIAIEKAKEHGVSWKRDYGTSDGVNRSKAEYIGDRKLQERSNVLDVQERTLRERETSVIEKEAKVAEREKNVISKEKANDDEREILIRHKRSLNARETSLDARKASLDEREVSLDERAQEIKDNAEAERNRLQRIHDGLINHTDIINKSKSRVDFLKNRMTDIFQKMPIPESVRRDLIAYMNGADKTVMTDSTLKTTRPNAQKIAELHDDLEF